MRWLFPIPAIGGLLYFRCPGKSTVFMFALEGMKNYDFAPEMVLPLHTE